MHRQDSTDAERPDSDIKKNKARDTAEILLIVMSLVVVISALFFKVATVSGDSMESTLSDGDIIIFSGLFYTPCPGDIVVFDANSDEIKRPLVKRVIATEGQTVDIDKATGKITVDGSPLDEPYITDITIIGYGTEIFPYTVEEDRAFLLGDNRNNSVDSRSDIIGTVPVKNILGKVIFRLFPIRSAGIPK